MEPVTIELRRYFEVLRRRINVIVLIAALAVGGVVLQIGMQPTRYQADVSMLVTPQSVGPSGLEAPDLSNIRGGFNDAVVSDIMFLMKSRTLLQRAGERLGMDGSDLEGRVSVSKVPGTDVLDVSARDRDPDRAALIANTVTQEFTEYYSQINRAEATNARKFIEDQLSRTKSALNDAEAQLAAFKSRNGAVALTDQSSRMVNRALDMQAAYDAALLDERTADAKIAAIRGRLGTQSGQLGQLTVATNPVFAKLRDTLTGLETDLASMRQTYTDEHPKVQAQLGRIAEIKREMAAEAANIAHGQSLGMSPVQEQLITQLVTGQVDREAAQARVAGMSQMLAKMQANLGAIPASELQLARLQRDVQVREQTYMKLSSLYEDALIKERKAGSSGQAAVFVVDPATSGWPVSKRLPLMGTFAALLGLVVGAAVALLLDGLDDRVRSPHEAEGAYGIPVLGTIPVMDRRSHAHLSGASTVAATSLPMIVAVLLGLGAAAASLYLLHQGAGNSDQMALFSRFLQVFQSVR
jgi:succinoglycan biosynthesis transport protein ExoP